MVCLQKQTSLLIVATHLLHQSRLPPAKHRRRRLRRTLRGIRLICRRRATERGQTCRICTKCQRLKLLNSRIVFEVKLTSEEVKIRAKDIHEVMSLTTTFKGKAHWMLQVTDSTCCSSIKQTVSEISVTCLASSPQRKWRRRRSPMTVMRRATHAAKTLPQVGKTVDDEKKHVVIPERLKQGYRNGGCRKRGQIANATRNRRPH